MNISQNIGNAAVNAIAPPLVDMPQMEHQFTNSVYLREKSARLCREMRPLPVDADPAWLPISGCFGAA